MSLSSQNFAFHVETREVLHIVPRNSEPKGMHASILTNATSALLVDPSQLSDEKCIFWFLELCSSVFLELMSVNKTQAPCPKDMVP